LARVGIFASRRGQLGRSDDRLSDTETELPIRGGSIVEDLIPDLEFDPKATNSRLGVEDSGLGATERAVRPLDRLGPSYSDLIDGHALVLGELLDEVRDEVGRDRKRRPLRLRRRSGCGA
jgi:hypothetical protein